jgi:hypothetical protein
MASIFDLVARALNLEPTKLILALSPRSHNILRHYQRELDRSHLGPNDALDRCLGDLAGRSWKDGWEQRSEVRL